MNTPRLVGFDPGRDKCGVAIATSNGEILHREILRSSEVSSRLQELFDIFHFDAGEAIDLVMGNQTTARQWKAKLLNVFPNLNVCSIDERFSSQEARRRYWDLYPAKGLQRLIPLGLREPPRPIDDIVAQILIERYLHQQGP